MQEEVGKQDIDMTVQCHQVHQAGPPSGAFKCLVHRKNKKLQKSRTARTCKKPYGRSQHGDLKKQYGDMKEIDLQDKGLQVLTGCPRAKVQYAVYKTAKEPQYQIFFKAPQQGRA